MQETYSTYKQQADKEYIERRRVSALWYAFGRQDTGETVDPIKFSHYAEDQAEDYRLEKVSMLDSVQDQYETFVKENS